MKKILTDIFARGNSHIDGVCYVLMSVFPFLAAYISTDDARKFISLRALFWAGMVIGIFNVTVVSIKNFRSTAFADSARNNGGKVPPVEPQKESASDMTKIATLLLIVGLGFSACAQSAQPTQMSTNAPANTPAPFAALYNILPSYDPAATNTFHAGDLDVGVLPMWKTATVSGSTPYMAAQVDYFYAKNFGVRGELVMLGDGAGNSAIDSAAIDAIARYDAGNLCVYALAGPCHDWHTGKYGGEGGVGIAYRYTTGISAVTETRYRIEGGQDRSGFVTTAGIKFALHR